MYNDKFQCIPDFYITNTQHSQ